MGEIWRRLWYFLNRSRFERELRDEMEAHRALKGAAGPRFGNSLRLREEAADQWGWGWFERLSQDLRFAVRLLRRAPAFTVTAVTVLALGVGLNLAAFQVIDVVALSWLPVRSPETLVKLNRRSPRGTNTAFSYPAFDFYRRSQSSLTSAIAQVHGDVTLGDDEVHRVDAEFVTPTYFTDLGAAPLAGRLLAATDDGPAAAPVIVLAEGLWASRFGRDPSILGRPLRVNGSPFTVVGIVPSTFVGLDDREARAWVPIAQHGVAFPGSTVLTDWKASPVRFYARMREGLTPPAAEQELRPVVDALRAERPGDVWDGEWLAIKPAGQYVSFEEAAPALALVGALVGLVLVTACMNLGLLVLARTLGRDREFAIRLSVGASRGRIVRQLLTEHLLLGVLGAAVGCFVAVQAARAFFVLSSGPAGLVPHFNLRALAVAAVLAVVSSVAFGFAPAWQALRPSVPRRLRLRSVLVGVQVAAASVLLIVSGLLVRGVTRIVRAPLGFDYRHTVLADPALESHGMSPAAADVYWRTADARIRAVPGVVSAALTTLPPFGNRVTVNRERTIFHHVTPSYFTTLRIPLSRGRVFADREAGVVLVSESLARRRWPGEDPIGKTFEQATVVGVVGNARAVRVGEQSATDCYLAIEPAHLAGAVMVVRVEGEPRPVAATLRSVARGGDDRLTPSVTLLEDALEAQLQNPRQGALVASLLGICALLLAVIGLGGMVAFTVSQRLREIGVRVALGARPAHVVRAIARQFMAPVLWGAAAGSALAAGVGTVMARELFGVSRLDPLAHGGALLLFATVAAVAALPSLRRALRVDPVTTLRHE